MARASARRRCSTSRPIVVSSIATRYVRCDLVAPQHRSGRTFDVGAREPDGGVADVDLHPAQPEQLPATGAGRRGQPQVGGEVRVALLDTGQQPLQLIR
jgi:hypothetical protein